MEPQYFIFVLHFPYFCIFFVSFLYFLLNILCRTGQSFHIYSTIKQVLTETYQEPQDGGTEGNMEKDKKKFKISFHLVFAVIAIPVLIIIISKFWGFGRGITQEEIDAIPVPDNPEITVYDAFFRAENIPAAPKDDGVPTIVCFGNAPFADDRDADDNPCMLLAAKTDAVVYNCSISGSYMSTYNEAFSADYAIDAFSFYHIAAAVTGNGGNTLSTALDAMGEIDGDTKAAIELLQTIDFNTVDFIYIMYDGSDHFAKRAIHNEADMSDTRFFTGSMISGIQLIRQAYPWIQVVVMSPAYAFDVAEDGSFISSDSKEFGAGRLSSYFFYQYDACAAAEITFIDNLYGGIREDTATDYLSDNFHLNAEGRKFIAAQMERALEKLTDTE